MDSSAAASSKFLFIFLGLSYIVCSSGSFLSDLKDIMQKQPKMEYSKKLLSPHRRELMIHTTQHDDFMNPPLTTNPTTPVTNPVTTPATGTAIAPPDPSSGPPMTDIPSANPMPPATDPTNPPFPVTFPGGGPPATTTPTNPSGGGDVPVTFPGGGPPATTTPTNPANPGGGGVVPVVGPPAVGNAPAVAGQSWCVARGGLPEATLQVALDYACGIGGADCSTIQQGQSCYNPNTLQNHASFAFNSYYQKNPVQTSCDFGGAAMVTNANPSSGSCIFPTGSGSASSASPATVSPTTPTTPMPTPATDPLYGGAPAGLGSPPTGLNPPSNPSFGGGIGGGYGDQTPPTASISSAHGTTGSLKPFIVVALSVVTGSLFRGLN